MELSNHLTYFASLPTIALLAGACILPAHLRAAEANEAQQNPGVTQRWFASPDEAVKALRAATEAHDKSASREIFGPEFDQFLTGNKAQDAKNGQKFAAARARLLFYMGW
jgi:hypothetical protein